MSTDASLAEESPPAVETVPRSAERRKKQRAGAKPRKQPPYAVVVLNDEEHTFEYVIETLMKVFGYPHEKSFASRCKSTTLARRSSGRAAGRWPNSNGIRFVRLARTSMRGRR